MATVAKIIFKQSAPRFFLKMSATSKTGLLPTLKKKNIEKEMQGQVTIELPKLAVPAPFILKPFAGIYNPFPYGCSVLCNHPADFEAKSIVKKAKDTWTADGRSLLSVELSVLRGGKETKQESQSLILKEDINDNVPEELFRKYTNTDSRPITPTPTLASVVTKNLRARRCMTPDPTSFTPAKEKTSLVLDLRRSHSQETVCWQGGFFDDFNFDDLQQEPVSKTASPSSTGTSQTKKKKLQRKKTGLSSTTVSSLKSQTSKDSDLKTQQSSVSQSPSKESVFQEKENSSKNLEEFSESPSENILKRRGKKTKKGKKTGKGDKEFQGIPEPGETQVSALDSDSLEGSSRQSLEEDKFQDKIPEKCHSNQEAKTEPEKTNTSFLNRDTLKRLQSQLDQEIVDSELNTKRKIALQEALKHKKNPKYVQQGEEMKNLKKEFQLVIKDSEKWLSMPRIFTRRSARFELPMDSRVLNTLTPMQYIQKYVFASPERLVLYNHVFNLYKEEPEDEEERDRIILGKKVTEALGKVMGRPLTMEEGNEFQNLLNWKDEASLDFRAFTGICAACERLMSSRFCSRTSEEEDPRHEIEKADFETLDEKLLRLRPDPKLGKAAPRPPAARVTESCLISPDVNRSGWKSLVTSLTSRRRSGH